MSGRTTAGGIIVAAGPHTVETTSGGYLNVDTPIGRELADLVEQTIAREGLTPSVVMAVEFRGEGRPIITALDDEFMRRQVRELREANR